MHNLSDGKGTNVSSVDSAHQETFSVAVMLMWLCGILHKQYGGVRWVWTSNCFLHINFLWLTLIGLCQNLLDSVIKNYSCKPMLHGNIGGHTWSMHQLICHTSFLLIVYFLSGYRVLQRWGVTNKISSRNLQQWIKYFIENFVETLYLLGGWNPWKDYVINPTSWFVVCADCIYCLQFKAVFESFC